MTPTQTRPAPRADASGAARARLVADAVTQWRRHLVDLGGRNTLLWYQDLPMGTLDLTIAHPGGVSMLLAGRRTRLSDLVREQVALVEARTRARAIHAKVVELAEERGVSVGFVAIGMASWDAPSLRRPPQAPVLLRSCDLRPTDASEEDFEVDLGDEVELNPVLEHYLRSEQGVDVDGAALAALSTHPSGFDPYPVYAALARLCEGIPGFAIAPRLVVSTFAHAKLPMVADLADQAATLADHDVVAALAGDPTAADSLRRTLPDPVPDPDPAHERLVLDADSSQQAAVDAVLAGASLIVAGPPGTGKTQTIANLVAALAAEGRRVLVVAEKRAAIEALKSRLSGVGLGELVFDAKDAAMAPGRVAQEFATALDGDHETRIPDQSAVITRLRDRRQRLAEHVAALHEVREPWGVSAHEMQWAMAELGARDPAPASRIRLTGEMLRTLSRGRVDSLARDLSEAAAQGAWSSDPGGDPWYGATITTDEEVAWAEEIVTSLGGGGLARAAAALDGILRESSLPPARTLADWESALGTMSGVRGTLEVFRPEVFDIPLDEHVAATASRAWRTEHDVSLDWWSRVRARRQAKRLLRPGRPPADLHAELVTASRQRAAWHDLVGAGGRPEISPRLDEAQAAFEDLRGKLEWLDARLATTKAGGGLTGVPVAAVQARLAELAGRLERLAVLPRVVGVIDELRSVGMGEVVDDFAHRGVTANQVTPELEHIWWASVARQITASDPRYGQHDGAQLRRAAADFRASDVVHRDATAQHVRAALGRATAGNLKAFRQQAALLRAEAAKHHGHTPLAELLPQALETLTAIRPCWAMSPLAVAQLLPPGQWFDVVIVDEASQVAPAEAVSAISRARQVVLVGDPHQGPPTRFTTTASPESQGDEDGDGGDGGEPADSILDALAAALPTRTLSWHYRSRDERLFGLANRAVYGGTVVTFPAASATPAVSLEQVDGSAPVPAGRDAGIETTDAEVDKVLALVLEHARARGTESLGVVTLNAPHAARIAQALRASLASGSPDLRGFFDPSRPERFFVKPMHRVQGEERDQVILAVGYGKTPHGRVLHRFGRLAAPGGERLVTVAMTRARRRMVVVSSLTEADLDPARLSAKGPLLLRELLGYAASGGALGTATTGGVPVASGGPTVEAATPARDPLMADLAGRLRREGFTVHEDHGLGARRIDLAVEDPRRPGRLLVAVESDGASYAGLRGARERDRIWVEQLERLGWKHVRVWSTDLFRDPAREVARVAAAVREAAAEPDAATSTDRAGWLPSAAGESDSGPEDERGAGAVTRKKRRRRMFRRAPDQSTDDTDAGWGQPPDEGAHDDWLFDQRPPHWA